MTHSSVARRICTPCRCRQRCRLSYARRLLSVRPAWVRSAWRALKDCRWTCGAPVFVLAGTNEYRPCTNLNRPRLHPQRTRRAGWRCTSCRRDALQFIGNVEFPDVFRKSGSGFNHAILGNPPWDASQVRTRWNSSSGIECALSVLRQAGGGSRQSAYFESYADVERRLARVQCSVSRAVELNESCGEPLRRSR